MNKSIKYLFAAIVLNCVNHATIPVPVQEYARHGVVPEFDTVTREGWDTLLRALITDSKRTNGRIDLNTEYEIITRELDTTENVRSICSIDSLILAWQMVNFRVYIGLRTSIKGNVLVRANDYTGFKELLTFFRGPIPLLSEIIGIKINQNILLKINTEVWDHLERKKRRLANISAANQQTEPEPEIWHDIQNAPASTRETCIKLLDFILSTSRLFCLRPDSHYLNRFLTTSCNELLPGARFSLQFHSQTPEVTVLDLPHLLLWLEDNRTGYIRIKSLNVLIPDTGETFDFHVNRAGKFILGPEQEVASSSSGLLPLDLTVAGPAQEEVYLDNGATSFYGYSAAFEEYMD